MAKKVWVLERFMTREDLKNQLKDAEFMFERTVNEPEFAKYRETAEQYREAVSRIYDENPDGKWYGTEGKTDYRAFCAVASEYIRRNREKRVRVVEAMIPDDSVTWIGYVPAKENEGVLRFLMAAAR